MAWNKLEELITQMVHAFVVFFNNLVNKLLKKLLGNNTALKSELNADDVQQAVKNSAASRMKSLVPPSKNLRKLI